ncbi:MAG TPA: hypothetical protein DCY13_23655 [Verrucomicrobiales bacterium]|nr:hypothetical protein [Verrucomicrobiales bacterium]
MILESYRPGGQDAQDPAFAEALVLAARDPELGEWFARQSKLDEAISERLRQANVPADLRNAILAGHRSQESIDRPNFTWWKSPALAWAAAIVLLFAAALIFRNGGSSSVALAAYRNAMTDQLNQGVEFDWRHESPAALTEWLANNRDFGALQLPAELSASKTIGCRVLEFDSLRPALICFTLPSNDVVHLFVVNGDCFGANEVSGQAKLAQCGQWNTVSWRQEDRVYLLAGLVAGDKLVQLASAGN